MQMVVFSCILLLAVGTACGQAVASPAGTPRSGSLGTNSPSLEELRKLIWNTPAAPGVTSGNHLPGPVPSATLAGYVPDDKYKLRVGDRISFQILEDRGAPGMLLVADSGEVEFPYVGRVSASDKTCKQLAESVKALLEKDYYYKASVVLALDTANRVVGRVYVWGQVRTQGPVEMVINETMTAGKAILRAGGFGDFANKKKVKVLRGTESTTGTARTFELNMVEILENGKTDKDMVLEPDDFIIVPQRLINF